jgi:hypothetical protein
MAWVSFAGAVNKRAPALNLWGVKTISFWRILFSLQIAGYFFMH